MSVISPISRNDTYNRLKEAVMTPILILELLNILAGNILVIFQLE